MKWIEVMKGKKLFVLLAIFLIFPLSPLAQENQPAWSVYFSPHGGCTEAIIKELDKAKSTILVQAFLFTSVPIAKGLISAHKRGIKVGPPGQEPKDREIFAR